MKNVILNSHCGGGESCVTKQDFQEVNSAQSDNAKYNIAPIASEFIYEFEDLNFKDLRTLNKKTLRQVASDTGISNPYLSQLENNKIKQPSFTVIINLLKYYGFKVTISKSKDISFTT